MSDVLTAEEKKAVNRLRDYVAGFAGDEQIFSSSGAILALIDRLTAKVRAGEKLSDGRLRVTATPEAIDFFERAGKRVTHSYEMDDGQLRPTTTVEDWPPLNESEKLSRERLDRFGYEDYPQRQNDIEKLRRGA